MIVRPGPARIEPNQAPGGLVIHVYAVDRYAGRCILIVERRLRNYADALEHAAADADAVFNAGEECVLVIYDGDTGIRGTPYERDVRDD